ncbi:MAG: hypothetical protein ACRC8A_02090 [Microcoleaceae cyanobacterium]
MLFKRLEKFLMGSETNPLNSRILFWLGLSLVLSISFAIPALNAAFQSDYLVMDDARQHLFWMQRFVDPELFPDDLIANFYQSVTAPGVTTIYRLMNRLGIEPLVLSKLLPLVLGLITTGYCFLIGLELLPVPMVGFIGSLLLNQNLWLHGELVTATSTAFLYPTFLAFLYYLLRRSSWGVGISLLLTGLCYAPMLLIAAGILCLRLICWRDWKFTLTRTSKDYLLFAVGMGVTVSIILFYAGQASEFGPTAIASEARMMPEFLENGRTAFFYEDSFWNFWFKNSRSGIKLSLNPPLVALGLLLPIALRVPQFFPLTKKVKQDVAILPQLLLSSFILFFMAHGILFKLYLPSRYTSHSLRITLAIATAIFIVLALDGVFKACSRSPIMPLLITIGLGILLIFYPKLVWQDAFPRSQYLVGSESGLYLFLQNQPKASLIASLAIEADNLPTFAQRPVLVSWEHALPYKMGYYRQIRQRARDLIQAHYSSDPQVIREFITTYGVDFFVLERDAFEAEYVTENSWFIQWEDLAQDVTQLLATQSQPILLQKINLCKIFETPNLIVLEANCVNQ